MAQPRSSDPIPSGPWDVVVIGAGAAGLMTCLDLPPEFKVLLLTHSHLGYLYLGQHWHLPSRSLLVS